jgi:hypothetical protein
MFSQFLDAKKFRLETINYDIVNKRHSEQNNQRSNDLEIEIYSELSFNFLQLNMKEESKLFG